MSEHIERIKSIISPSQIISKNVNLKTKGNGEYLGLCPFHDEKTPSFTISDTKGFYHCFGCGAHGDIFTFLMEKEGLPYKEALTRLAEQAGVPLPQYKPVDEKLKKKSDICYSIYDKASEFYHKSLFTSEGKQALEYLKKRRIKDEIIQLYKLGFAPLNSNKTINYLKKLFPEKEILESKVIMQGERGLYNQFRGRVIFPILDKRSRVVAFGGRTLLADGKPKYLNSSENPIFNKSDILYGLNIAQEHAFKLKEIIITEGYIDVLSLANCGINHSVAPLGTSIRVSQIQPLWQFVDEPLICMDSDEAGRRAAIRLAKESLEFITPGKSLRFMILTGGKDPDEVINKYGKDYFELAMQKAIPLADLLFEIEKKEKPLNTPENRADLKERLFALAEKTRDKSLSTSYRLYFRDKFSELFSRKKQGFQYNSSNYKNHNTVPKAETKVAIKSIMKKTDNYINDSVNAILSNVIAHPELLRDSEIKEKLSQDEDDSGILDKLHDYVLNLNSFSEFSDDSAPKNKFEEITHKLLISKKEREKKRIWKQRNHTIYAKL